VESFDATIRGAPRGGAFVEVPAGVVDALGGNARIPVSATFDGVAYRGSIASMGGRKVLGVLKAIRTELGKEPGDRVKVTVEFERAERTVDVPDDLAVALRKARLRAAFDALSFSHRREYVTWIEEAKKPETRRRRVDETVDRVGGTR
jgi:hypothetical protein